MSRGRLPRASGQPGCLWTQQPSLVPTALSGCESVDGAAHVLPRPAARMGDEGRRAHAGSQKLPTASSPPLGPQEPCTQAESQRHGALSAKRPDPRLSRRSTVPGSERSAFGDGTVSPRSADSSLWSQ